VSEHDGEPKVSQRVGQRVSAAHDAGRVLIPYVKCNSRVCELDEIAISMFTWKSLPSRFTLVVCTRGRERKSQLPFGQPTVGKKDAGRVPTPTCTMSQLACSPNTPDTTRDLGTSRTRATEVSHEHVSPMRSQHALGDASTTPTDVKSAKYRRPLEPSSRRCGDDEGRKSVEAKASCGELGIGLSGCN